MAFTSVKVSDVVYSTEVDDSLICLICLEVARDPLQHGICGRLFCGECVQRNNFNLEPCPNCRYPKPQYFKDTKSRREIDNLRVICMHKSKGCAWEGTLGQLDDHKTSCQFMSVLCNRDCHVWIMRKDLNEHMNNKCPYRMHSCKHCGKVDTFTAITKDHEPVCDMKRIRCISEGCTEFVQRGKIKTHLKNDCRYKIISCKYASIGCKRKLMRINIGAHEKEYKAHLSLAIDTVVKLKEKVETLTLRDGESMTFKLTDYQHKRDNHEEYRSPSFYTPSGYHMRIEVHPQGIGDGINTHISVFIEILEGRNDDKLSWPYTGTVTVELLNHLEDANHHHMEMEYTDINRVGQVGSRRGNYKYISHSTLTDMWFLKRCYLKNDILYFRVSFFHSSWLECTVR